MPVPRGRSFDLHCTGWLNKKKATAELGINPIENPSIRLDFEMPFE